MIKIGWFSTELLKKNNVTFFWDVVYAEVGRT